MGLATWCERKEVTTTTANIHYGLVSQWQAVVPFMVQKAFLV